MSYAADFGITLTQHVLRKQQAHPGASGQFSMLMTQIGVAAKQISAAVRRAGLIEILGATGDTNVQGERVQKLDLIANDTLKKVLRRSECVAAMASEEDDEIVLVDDRRAGEYVVAFDPLDGSSNIDVSVSIGTVFAVYHRLHNGTPAGLEDVLRPGREQVGAGYVIYGSSTVLVYTDGITVDSFTLDPGAGEFFLTRSNIKYPERTKILSLNENNEPYWTPWVKPYLEEIRSRNTAEKRTVTARHIGSLVSDFHRNLLKGGVFLYPETDGRGKLRVLYECNPLAFIAKVAGGYASTGRGAILDLVPTDLHERSGLIIGPKADVELAEQFYRKYVG